MTELLRDRNYVSNDLCLDYGHIAAPNTWMVSFFGFEDRVNFQFNEHTIKMLAIEIDDWVDFNQVKNPDRKLRIKIGSALRNLDIVDVVSLYEFCEKKPVEIIKDSFENDCLIKGDISNLVTWSGSNLVDVMLRIDASMT